MALSNYIHIKILLGLKFLKLMKHTCSVIPKYFYNYIKICAHIWENMRIDNRDAEMNQHVTAPTLNSVLRTHMM